MLRLRVEGIRVQYPQWRQISFFSHVHNGESTTSRTSGERKTRFCAPALRVAGCEQHAVFLRGLLRVRCIPLFCRSNVPFMSSQRLLSRGLLRMTKTVSQTVMWVMPARSWDTKMGRCHLRSQRWSLSSANAASAVTACWSTLRTSSDRSSLTAVKKMTKF